MRYLVLHYSLRWDERLAVKRCETVDEAKKYIQQFKNSHAHKGDTFEIVPSILNGQPIKKHRAPAFSKPRNLSAEWQ